VKIEPAKRGGGGDRPYLGSIPDFSSEAGGYKLMGVGKDSPAEKAGMKAGDTIIRFDQYKIGSLEDIDGALRKFKAGDKVKVTVLREGKEVVLEVTLGDPR
jgi:S1-C subfamily serine protease